MDSMIFIVITNKDCKPYVTFQAQRSYVKHSSNK